MQIGNEANFVYKRGLSTFLHFSSWLRGMSTSNMYLSLIGSTWIRSIVHANYSGSDPVCTPEKSWIRSKKERSRTDPLSCAQGLNVRCSETAGSAYIPTHSFSQRVYECSLEFLYFSYRKYSWEIKYASQ